MNQRQIRVFCAGSVGLLLMGLFPPWTAYYLNAPEMYVEPQGYAFILTPPTPPRSPGRSQADIHTGRLLAQFMCLAGATGLGLFLTSSLRTRSTEAPPYPPGT